ncbi:hypothetical protein ACXYUI_31045, partial [Klebsiella pneumoniae]
MSAPTVSVPSVGTSARELNIGFHTRVPFASGRAAEGLRDGITLFREAEDLGFDRGWVYQRHF